MSATSERAFPKNRKKRTKAPDSRTKFDVWLDRALAENEYVTFLFATDPVNEEPGKKTYVARIITVDRYMIFLEISLGEDRVHKWVAKDNILSAE